MADSNPIIDVPNNITAMPGASGATAPLVATQLPPIPAGLSFNIEGMLRSPITWMAVGAVAMFFIMRSLKSHS
jgi:hypothetical protein